MVVQLGIVISRPIDGLCNKKEADKRTTQVIAWPVVFQLCMLIWDRRVLLWFCSVYTAQVAFSFR